jgi:hypothetical protein
METAPPAPRLAAAPRRLPWREAGRGIARLLAAALLDLAGIAATLAMLAAAYSVKRALGLDLVPGIDVLPDAEIEGAIHALFGSP